MADTTIIIPNLHWRYSGVTAANRAMAPRIGAMLPAFWLGRDRPSGVSALTLAGLLRLRGSRARVIWHARRNNEMIAGLLLRALGWPLTLVFTSAAQRHHTAFTRWLIARMDGVIATSPASASYLKRPASVILHGVDTELYRPPHDRDAAAAQAGLPARYAIGCFGRVREQKGTDLFVAAMCKLLPRYPDFCAVVVGSVTPDQRAFADGVRQQAQKAGLRERILFLGELPVDAVPDWFARVLIYAFTSRNEGFGLTLLEAMASGAALVAARAGGARAVVDDGVTGILVPAGDAAALEAALENLMRDPQAAHAMGARAREAAVARFSADREAEKIVKFYETLR